MSDLHVDSSFYKQSMKINNNHKIKECIDYSIGPLTVIQELNKKGPTLSPPQAGSRPSCQGGEKNWLRV